MHSHALREDVRTNRLFRRNTLLYFSFSEVRAFWGFPLVLYENFQITHDYLRAIDHDMMSARTSDDSLRASRETLHLFLQISPNRFLVHVLRSPTKLVTIRILRNDQIWKPPAAREICHFLRRVLQFVPLPQGTRFISGTALLGGVEIGEASQWRRNVWTASPRQACPANSFLECSPPCFMVTISSL